MKTLMRMRKWAYYLLKKGWLFVPATALFLMLAALWGVVGKATYDDVYGFTQTGQQGVIRQVYDPNSI